MREGKAVSEIETPGSGDHPTADTTAAAVDGAHGDGIITGLAELPRDALVDAKALGKLLGRSKRSVERAVRRGELPPPFRFMGRNQWTVATIRDHLNARQAASLRLVERRDQRRASGG